ncbi:hypothetical protein BDQ12DRAFT_713578 [Crucibulum laeve]|uniref:Uncharacterized protein n=1 Tax=Crucibulum laeve TaxID=68775 RepID=A0A5C3LWJ5_9AGAR|nr:hypothetical protein BDQ12DRAFT_713578 [Crucibulum laeve]
MPFQNPDVDASSHSQLKSLPFHTRPISASSTVLRSLDWHPELSYSGGFPTSSLIEYKVSAESELQIVQTQSAVLLLGLLDVYIKQPIRSILPAFTTIFVIGATWSGGASTSFARESSLTLLLSPEMHQKTRPHHTAPLFANGDVGRCLPHLLASPTATNPENAYEGRSARVATNPTSIFTVSVAMVSALIITFNVRAPTDALLATLTPISNVYVAVANHTSSFERTVTLSPFNMRTATNARIDGTYYVSLVRVHSYKL